jgi:hypothetical protein
VSAVLRGQPALAPDAEQAAVDRLCVDAIHVLDRAAPTGADTRG